MYILLNFGLHNTGPLGVIIASIEQHVGTEGCFCNVLEGGDLGIVAVVRLKRAAVREGWQTSRDHSSTTPQKHYSSAAVGPLGR